MHEIERENQRLLQKLSQIMSVNRLENFWKQPHPNFLNRVYIKTPPLIKRAQSVPPPSKKSIITNEITSIELQKSIKSRSCMRCPTCSGKPITTNVVNKRILTFVFASSSFSSSQSYKSKLNVCFKMFSFAQVIPEERVPFAPPRKSWNCKLINDKSNIHRCCKLCC